MTQTPKACITTGSWLSLRKIVRRGLRTVRVFYWTGQLRLKLWYNRVPFGRGVHATGPVHLVVHPDGKMRIGDGVHINSGSHRNPVGGGVRCIIDVGPGANLEIGPNTGMSSCEIICRKQISIGEYCLLGGSSRIYDSDFHSIDSGMRRCRPDRGTKTTEVKIGRDVFIGAHATILKGVTIGDCAVIGAGAVVTRPIPADEIWAGNPARRIGSVNRQRETGGTDYR